MKTLNQEKIQALAEKYQLQLLLLLGFLTVVRFAKRTLLENDLNRKEN